MQDPFYVFLLKCASYQQAQAAPDNGPAIARAVGKHHDSPEVLQLEIYLLEWSLGRNSGVYTEPSIAQAEDLVYFQRLLDEASARASTTSQKRAPEHSPLAACQTPEQVLGLTTVQQAARTVLEQPSLF